MAHMTSAWKELQNHASEMKDLHLKDLLQDTERNSILCAEHGDLYLDYSRQNVNLKTMDKLFDLAEATGVQAKLNAMAAGDHINVTEDRAVGHMALRAPKGKEMHVDGKDVVGDVHQVLDRIRTFTTAIRTGSVLGVTGKPITNVISIGIGGSYLGPEFVYEALREEVAGKEAAKGRVLRFLANVDPVDVARATKDLDPETTMVIVVSKTFTTAETILNAKTLRQWLVTGISKSASEDVVAAHMIAVSAAVPKAQAFGINGDNVFGFWDWVGGRYSVCSAVGVVPLALHYGMDIVEKFLAGAHDMDTHVLEAPLRSNLPIIMGLCGVWNSTFLGHTTRAILPYSQALLRFAAHIQQVDMESNGKRVALDGTVLPFSAGEINFGEPGTNGQHSFYQLIHQGRVIPCDFIGFVNSQNPIALEGEVVSNHDELMSNFFAQPDALANGKSAETLKAEGVPENLIPHKTFPGNRPSISLLLQKLDAFSCGQLLALYEHRTVVQGAIWGINSFDQWGVELGKVLASQVRTQLSASRKSQAPVQGFNSSTTAMLNDYLGNKRQKI